MALEPNRDKWEDGEGELVAALEDAERGAAAENLLGSREDLGGQRELGVGEVPAKDALKAVGIREASGAEVVALSEDDSGVVSDIED